MRNLLVTGGAGFIGSNFVHYWLAQHPQDTIFVLDALSYAGTLSNLDPCKDNSRYTFIHADICNQNKIVSVLRDHNIDTIVHFAAESHVDKSISAPDAFIDANINGTYSLLKAAKHVWLNEETCAEHHFHHISTDEVYGTLGVNDPPFSETTAYAPNSPYAASKAAADHLVRAYHHSYGLKATTSNCSNNYGPHHFPEKLIPLCIVNLLHGKPLPIYGDGNQIRDWLYVEDHCRAIDAVLSKREFGQTYNFGGCNQVTNLALVTMLCKLADQEFSIEDHLSQQYPHCPASKKQPCNSLITHVTDRPGHDRRYAINAEKASRALGWQPTVQLEEGLKRTLQWYIRNEAWWKPLLKRSLT